MNNNIKFSGIITPIYKLDKVCDNNLYIKRDDLFPFSFGGNKARKAVNFFNVIDNGDYDTVVTYGSSSSNHCRIVSNMAVMRDMRCIIISPEETSETTYNSKMMELFGAEIITVSVEKVTETIERKICELKKTGKKPYFIPGGGHGNIGTQAYVDCYNEICRYEQENGIYFDYIYFASGTGTTHAGLLCGKLINNDERSIVGISIARKNPRGSDVILESINDYLEENSIEISQSDIKSSLMFVDDYVSEGYGQKNNDIDNTIIKMLKKYGIPTDSTYTAKACVGMFSEICKKEMNGKNILYIHTGGTPLFFDDMERLR